MFSSPGFNALTHQYGQSFGGCEATDALEDTTEETSEGEEWAGKGFDKPYEEPDERQA